MSKLKVNEIDSKTGTTITVTTGKTLDIPAGGTINVAGTQTVSGTQTVTGTVNLTSSTLTLPATLPATAGTNITSLPGANITGTIPLAALGNAPATDVTGLQDDIALLGFKTQANGSLAKYSLVDQTLDAFEDATGVDASASTDEIRSSSGKYYTGASTGATGGTITTYSSGGTDYKVHTFTADGNFVLDGAGDANILVVAGGGSGGYYSAGPSPGSGGGGGGGGVLEGTLALTSATFAITVGAGGAQNASGGSSGVDSVWDTAGTPATADGGGAGVTVVSGSSTGGSGGGGAANVGGNGSSSQSDSGGLTGYGYGGGGSGSLTRSAGAGGGAGAVGGAGNGSSGVGGAGRGNLYQTGVTQYYAGGGGGGGNSQGSGGAGGSGGGGPGGTNSNGTAGTVNTGGGGGGGNTGQGGGSGIVIVRYIDGAMTANNNMTLVSTATTAQAVPTKGDIVLTYTNGNGTATINTDLIASVSRDNGTTYSAVTLALQGTTGGHTILTAHDVDISGQPSGSSMRWKVATANQSASKETRIQAVSLGWS